MQWEETMRRIGVNENNVKTFAAKDQHEMLRKLKPYLTQDKDRQSRWPLVAMITVCFDDPLLQLGLEIYDIPGASEFINLRAPNFSYHGANIL